MKSLAVSFIYNLLYCNSMASKEILEKLDEIKSELDYIKGHMVDKDQLLSDDDKKALAEAEEEYKEDKTTSLDQLQEELGL